MRLRLLTIVGTMALALAVPSAALAHHGRGHHHHHKSKHKAHHANFHVRNIRPTGTTPPTGAPTTPPAEENAGTVTSYEKEVLTLTLKDNSTVSGKVTADTHTKCISPATTTTEPPNEGPGDDNGSGDDQNGGDRNQSGGGWGDHKDGGDDGQWGQQSSTPEPPCDTSSLTPGTVVHSAQLRIGASGNEWECIVLVRPSS